MTLESRLKIGAPNPKVYHYLSTSSFFERIFWLRLCRTKKYPGWTEMRAGRRRQGSIGRRVLPPSDWTAKRINWAVLLRLSFLRMLALCTATVLPVM